MSKEDLASHSEYSNDSDNPDQTLKKKEPPTIVVNVVHAEYNIIKEVIRDTMHWKPSYKVLHDKDCSNIEWDLYWHDLIINPELLMKVKPYQKVNHFPGMQCLFMKNLLSNNLNKIKKLYPKEYSFFPNTWVLPLEWNEFKAKFTGGKTKTFIVKPEGKSQGRGIRLIRNWTEVDPNTHCVIQEYIKHPLLIEGLKFDLRIYILVYGCDPYRIFMYKEGLTRLATEPYSVPKGSNIKNEYIHLTNYAINKDNENYKYNTDSERADTGHKRRLELITNESSSSKWVCVLW